MELWQLAPVLSDSQFSAGSSTSVNALSDRKQLAVTWELDFMVTTERSLPITALYDGFEKSDTLVLDAKNDLALEGGRRRLPRVLS